MVKVGTSTLNPKGGPPDTGYIQDLAHQIASLGDAGHSVILVSSGAIRAGMARLGLTGRPRTIPQKQAAAAVGQGLLMQSYAEAFAVHGLSVGQVLLTRDDLRDRSRYLNARNTLAALLRAHVIPIINENDTVAVEEIKFGDNDTLAALVSSLAEADVLLLLSDVAGLYSSDPTHSDTAQLIPLVDKIDDFVERLAGGTQSALGTGGMTTKIQAARICVRTGTRMVIADGRRPHVLRDALAGDCGTQFMPVPAPLRSRQRWIAYGLAPQGSIGVNAGAKARLVQEGKSLLPAGVVAVSGRFGAGDLVALADDQGQPFAQGFVNYSHDDIAKIMGRRTAEIAALLGSKPHDEVIHRDNLVLHL